MNEYKKAYEKYNDGINWWNEVEMYKRECEGLRHALDFAEHEDLKETLEKLLTSRSEEWYFEMVC